MINIKRFECNMLRENCYVVSDETKECVIIDCGAYYEAERTAITDYIKAEGLRPVRLLGTHGHLDHHFGDDLMYARYGLLPEVDKADSSFINDLQKQATEMFGITLTGSYPHPTRFLSANEAISFGSHTFVVLETPGHSPGSVTFYCKAEHVAFTGDTLFRNSIGRTDFEGGSMFQIINSLRMLAQLPDNTDIMPGHGMATTIAHELDLNPYMDR